jgi:hypothetical protein
MVARKRHDTTSIYVEEVIFAYKYLKTIGTVCGRSF